MFDYSAGEKYRLTLVMTAVAGIMAGAFFTMLLATSSPPPRRHVALQSYSQEPPGSVHYGTPPSQGTAGMAIAVAPPTAGEATGSQTPVSSPVDSIDPKDAKALIQQWLPLAWDLSAGTAAQDQEVAIKYMTPECAQSYRSTIWTPELARQIDEAGLRSAFQISSISEPFMQADGSAVIDVQGMQTITGANGQSSQRQVKLEYSLIDTPDGPRIASFKESGGSG